MIYIILDTLHETCYLSLTIEVVEDKNMSSGAEVFVDKGKAFDRMTREMAWWALRMLTIDEWLVQVIKNLYSGSRTNARVNGLESEECAVNRLQDWTRLQVIGS